MPVIDQDPPNSAAALGGSLSDRLLAALKGRVLVASRENFVQIYNTFVDRRPGDALRFQVIAARRQKRQPIADPDERTLADIEAALQEAKDAGFLEDFITTFGDRLIGPGITGGGLLETAKVLATAGSRDTNARDSVTTSLQAIVTAEPFRNPLLSAQGMMIARRRCCRIVVQAGPGNRITGSGFLIGPRLVLTNWHVVQSLLATRAGPAVPAGAFEATPGSDTKLSVDFDFTAGPSDSQGGPTSIRASRDWLVCASPAHPSEHGAHEGQPGWPNDPKDLAGFDDFAVIELDRAVGYERGFYNIVEMPLPPLNGRILVFHHPGTFMMRLSTGTLGATPPIRQAFNLPAGFDARVLHDANTIGGSSGGLVLNWDMQPVALHQAGLRYFPIASEHDDAGRPLKTAEINAAIPIERVVAVAMGAILARMGERKLPTYVTGRNSLGLLEAKPLIGRLVLQDSILRARDGKVRIIIVRPGFSQADRRVLSRVGKSFTARILEALLPPAEHRVVCVSAERFRNDAATTARALIDAVGVGKGATSVPAPAPAAAGPAQNSSTELIDQVNPSAGAVRDLFIREAGNGVFWLVIDDLEKFNVPDTSTQAFLEQLYREIAVHPHLRLVLIGVTDPDLAALRGIDPEAKWEEQLASHLDKKDVESWLRRRLDDPSPEMTRVFAGALVSASCRRTPESPSVAVADMISSDVEPEFSP
ncbi:hypothetical protein ABB55_14385 [Prosthecomicrobium hirschii]|uniref:Serine protease n=1 Tax=Prosthecodimorpha hirschii TaxID=665126 RepID=A0A0P6W7A8_9HYPH|nr:trypsin-like peptidase domain-containing protein [Prosthecomicrobium hirschii]KPL53253.1 hypothetical protein ABB55_14385 [Prosthecomicrobium hirschii]